MNPIKRNMLRVLGSSCVVTGYVHVINRAPDYETIISEDYRHNRFLNLAIANFTGWGTGITAPAPYDRMILGTSSQVISPTDVSVIAVTAAAGLRESDSLLTAGGGAYPAIAVTRELTSVANDSMRYVKTFQNTSGGTVVVTEMAVRSITPTALARAIFAGQSVIDTGFLTIDYKLVFISL